MKSAGHQEENCSGAQGNYSITKSTILLELVLFSPHVKNIEADTDVFKSETNFL